FRFAPQRRDRHLVDALAPCVPLREHGFVIDVGLLQSIKLATGERTELKISPKFVDGRPVLTDLKRVSKPGRRQYVGSQDIPRVLSGLGISILSTPKGVMSGASAKRQKLGGEILANIW
ncbi:MAG: 30S ribosomal protein S8, partial [Akkermansiaceae bacterium]